MVQTLAGPGSEHVAVLAGGSPALVAGAGLLALVLSVVLWPVVLYAVTVVHEGGHVMTGAAMGGKVRSVKLSRAGGVTDIEGLGPFGSFLTGLSGYVLPSVFGLVDAVLLRRDQVSAVLWLSLLFLIMMLIQAGNVLAAFVTVALGTAIVLVIRYATAGGQTFFAYTWTWLLLFGGFGGTLVLQAVRRAGDDRRSDAYRVGKATMLPASLWSGFFWLTSIVAMVFGAGIMLGFVTVHLR